MWLKTHTSSHGRSRKGRVWRLEFCSSLAFSVYSNTLLLGAQANQLCFRSTSSNLIHLSVWESCWHAMGPVYHRNLSTENANNWKLLFSVLLRLQFQCRLIISGWGFHLFLSTFIKVLKGFTAKEIHIQIFETWERKILFLKSSLFVEQIIVCI